MVVANLDTGVDYTPPGIGLPNTAAIWGRVPWAFDHNYNWYDPYWNTTFPQALPWQAGGTVPADTGPMSWGTMVGSAGANQIGVAPDAQWIATFGCCPDT